MSEFGTQILPTSWGLFGLLPSIAGLVAVVLLWTLDERWPQLVDQGIDLLPS